jgi:hypothetical protein
MPLIQQDVSVIRHFRGDNHTVTVTVRRKASAPPHPWVVQDITGASAVLTVKRKASDTPALFSVNGVITGAATLGVFTFEVLPAMTVALGPSSGYVYDIEIVLGTGQVYTVSKGKYDLLEDVKTP